MRKNFLILLLAGTVFCALVLSILLTASGDTLYDCTPILALSPSRCHVGDTLTMTFTLVPKHTRTVRFYSEMQKNIVVYQLERSDFLPRTGEIHSETFSPDHPLICNIVGKVTAAPDNDSAIVDFGKYGQVKVPLGTNIDFYARAYPAVIPSNDSREWPWSNHATLSVLE